MHSFWFSGTHSTSYFIELYTKKHNSATKFINTGMCDAIMSSEDLQLADSGMVNVSHVLCITNVVVVNHILNHVMSPIYTEVVRLI